MLLFKFRVWDNREMSFQLVFVKCLANITLFPNTWKIKFKLVMMELCKIWLSLNLELISFICIF